MIPRLLLAALLALAPVTAVAQAAALSSWAAIDDGLARAKTAMLASPPDALARARAAEQLLVRQRDTDRRTLALATARWLQGEALIRLDQLDAAMPVLQRGLRSVEQLGKQPKLLGDLLLSRGGINAFRTDVAAALSDYQRAFDIFDKVGEPRSQAIAMLSIASLYREAKDYRTALRYYQQASELYRADSLLSVSIYNNLGSVLGDLRRDREAERQFEKALEIAREMGSVPLEAQVLRNLARVQVQFGRLADADRTIRRGLALSRREDVGARIQLWSVSAQAALKRGDLATARTMLTRVFEGMDPSATTLSLRDAHLSAHDVFKRLGEPGQALVHLEALKRLDDQATALAASTNTALMAARFDFKNQELRIAKLKADELQRQARFQRWLFAGGAAGALVVFALLISFLLAMRRKRNELAASNAQLEKALAARTEFLATTSHEIRTPLNGILGMTQVMLADARLEAAMRDRLEVVQGAGLTMRALVDDILDVAKMETGQFTVELAPTDLHATLKEVTRLWQEQARARGIGFALDLSAAPRMIQADAGRLRQIVFNLLSNALKFTEAGDVVVTVAERAVNGEQWVRVTVRDSGIGIPSDKLAEIFEAFRQVDAGTTRRFGGTGLGLAICRNLARVMGGDVRVESAIGAGSTFTLDLPLLPVAEAAESPSDDVCGPASGDPVTLVIDRNPITRAMLRAMVEPVGPVVVSGSLEEALEQLERGGIARIVADENALGEDLSAGRETLVKAAEQANAWLVLLVREVNEQCHVWYGMLPKPVDADALRACFSLDHARNCQEPLTAPLVSKAA